MIDRRASSFNIPSAEPRHQARPHMASGCSLQRSIILPADGVSVFLCFFAISVQFVSISLYLSRLQAIIAHPECELQFFL